MRSQQKYNFLLRPPTSVVVPLGFFILAFLAFGHYANFNEQFIQSVILALTLVVVLWYTIETYLLRREAESRAERDREPKISCDVDPSQWVCPPLTSEYRFWFKLQNHSSNNALARITVRARIGSGRTIVSRRPGYDGKQSWEIIPFFQIQGWFDLYEIFRDFSSPLGDMTLGVQVDVYHSNDRKFWFELKREYRVRIRELNEIEFWPEVATKLPELGSPRELS